MFSHFPNGRRRGASVAPIIVCVVLIVVAAVVSYLMYDQGQKDRVELGRAQDELEARLSKLDQRTSVLAEWEGAAGLPLQTAESLMREAERPTFQTYVSYVQSLQEEAANKLETTRREYERTRREAEGVVADIAQNNRRMKERAERTLSRIYDTLDEVKSTQKREARRLAREKESIKEVADTVEMLQPRTKQTG